MNLSYPVHQLLVSGRGNTPDIPFPGGTADYITIHMTGNRAAGADAAAHANWMYTNAPYSWHVTVDDREAWHSIPWGMQGWHAGDGAGPGNRESIGIEICMNEGIDQTQAYMHAAELVAELKREGHGVLGVVQHHYWTGKNCPELIRKDGLWDWFLSQVESYYQGDPGMPESDLALMNRALQLRFALQRLAAHPELWRVEEAVRILRAHDLFDYPESLPK